MPLPTAVRERFKKINGVSFDDLNEHPELLVAVFGKKDEGSRLPRSKIFRGRGYPFLGKKRVCAKEREEKILDVLNNDWRNL